MLRAGALDPALRGLLTKDPAQRSTVEQTRRQLQAVLAGAVPSPSPPPPPTPPPPAPAAGPVPGGSVERIDAADLRALASASRALLGSVARDAREQARYLADRRRERKVRSPAPPPAHDAGVVPQRRRRRFKRRWVVVPVLVTVAVILLILIGAAYFLASSLGLL
jgi:hypothetical protein